MSEDLKSWFTALFHKKNTFMALVGWMIITTMLVVDFYQLIQINYFFGKGKIDMDAYERLSGLIISGLKEHSIMALLYYFGTKANEYLSSGKSGACEVCGR
jgi:hypothetical protein